MLKNYNRPPQLRERLFFIASVQNIVAVVVQCCWTEWSGCARKERNCDHFVGIENSKKKIEERGQKLARNSDPFLVPLSIGTFLEGSENGPIFGPAFWCRRATFEPVLGTANGATVSSAMQLSNSKL